MATKTKNKKSKVVEFNGYSLGTINTDDVVVPDVKVRELTKDEEFVSFVENIKNEGLNIPIEITKENVLVDGLRRLSAYKELGIEEIPFKTKKDGNTDDFVKGLEYNEFSRPMTPLELARDWKILIDEKGYTQKKIAETRGISVGKVSMTLSLLNLPEKAKDMLNDKDSNLNLSAAYELARLTKDEAEKVLEKIESGEDQDDSKPAPLPSSGRNSVNLDSDYIGRDIRMTVYPHMVRLTVDIEHKDSKFDNFDPVESVKNAFNKVYKEGKSASIENPNDKIPSLKVLQSTLASLKSEVGCD